MRCRVASVSVIEKRLLTRTVCAAAGVPAPCRMGSVVGGGLRRGTAAAAKQSPHQEWGQQGMEVPHCGARWGAEGQSMHWIRSTPNASHRRWSNHPHEGMCHSRDAGALKHVPPHPDAGWPQCLP